MILVKGKTSRECEFCAGFNYSPMKRVHFASGLFIAAFVTLHLLNHLVSLAGAEAHIAFMEELRKVYRHRTVESLLQAAVAIQVISGIRLFFHKRKTAAGFWEKLQIWSGLYLAFFFMIHITAVLAGRSVLKLDTNFYFGVAGLNSFPVNLFFIPYYALAILSFFAHVAAIHHSKMQVPVLGLKPGTQSKLILGTGAVLTLLIFCGLTNYFRGVEIPEAYRVLTGK